MAIRPPTDADYASLKLARDAYNRFYGEHVDQPVPDELTEAEVAARIPDLNVRQEFVRRAIEMLEANIRCDTYEATPIKFDVALDTRVAVSVVVLAALAYLLSGLAVSLAVALGYFLGYAQARHDARANYREVESHNPGVPVAKKYIDNWQRSLEELRALQRDLQHTR